MTKSSDFEPGRKFPNLGINNANSGPWPRWALPIGTGLAVALVVLYLI